MYIIFPFVRFMTKQQCFAVSNACCKKKGFVYFLTWKFGYWVCIHCYSSVWNAPLLGKCYVTVIIILLISINFVLIISKVTLLSQILDVKLSAINFWDTLLEHNFGKFSPTKLESDWKIYGIDLHYVIFQVIKRTSKA